MQNRVQHENETMNEWNKDFLFYFVKVYRILSLYLLKMEQHITLCISAISCIWTLHLHHKDKANMQ